MKNRYGVGNANCLVSHIGSHSPDPPKVSKNSCIEPIQLCVGLGDGLLVHCSPYVMYERIYSGERLE